MTALTPRDAIAQGLKPNYKRLTGSTLNRTWLRSPSLQRRRTGNPAHLACKQLSTPPGLHGCAALTVPDPDLLRRDKYGAQLR